MYGRRLEELERASGETAARRRCRGGLDGMLRREERVAVARFGEHSFDALQLVFDRPVVDGGRRAAIGHSPARTRTMRTPSSARSSSGAAARIAFPRAARLGVASRDVEASAASCSFSISSGVITRAMGAPAVT
jgi:hypothetical protein